MQRFDIVGNVTSQYALNDGGQWLTIESNNTGNRYSFFHQGDEPIVVGDAIGGTAIQNENGEFLFTRTPAVKPGCTEGTIKNTMFQALRRASHLKRKLDDLYRHFEIAADASTENLGETSISSNELSSPRAVQETISLYASRYREQDPQPVEDLKDAGLTKKMAKRLLHWWNYHFSTRRLMLLGLSKKDITDCLDIGWPDFTLREWEIREGPLYNQLVKNPYPVLGLSLSQADHICSILGLTLNDDWRFAGKIARHILGKTSENKWACYPTRFLQREFTNFDTVSSFLESGFKCAFRYNSVYLHMHDIVEKTLVDVLSDTTSSIKIPLSKPSREILCEEQAEAAKFALNNSVSVITGAAGTGKCLAPNTPVRLLSGGIINACDVTVGTKLVGDDGKARKVLTTASGRDQMFRVTPNDGDSFVCNAPHMLTLQEMTPTLTRNEQGYCVAYSQRGHEMFSFFETKQEAEDELARHREPFDIPLNEYLACQPTHGYLYTSGVIGTTTSLALDPWLLGLWISKGRRGDLVFDNTSDIERRRIDELVSPSGGETTTHGNSIFVDGGDLETHLRQTNVFLKATRLPQNVMTGLAPMRQQVLNGLVSGHGDESVGWKCTFPLPLVRDVRNLARSLGLCAFLNDNDVHIQYTTDTRTSFNVEVLGEGEYVGFQLDGNGRFLLGDYTVTHNTTLLCSIVHELMINGLDFHIVSFTGKAVGHVRKVLAQIIETTSQKQRETMTQHVSTIHRLLYSNLESSYDVILIDEISMVSNKLLAKLMNKVKYHDSVSKYPQLIALGDSNQLQSSGWGDLMNQMIKTVPTKTLLVDHRHEGDNTLFYNTNAISHGENFRFRWGGNCEFIRGQVSEVEDLVTMLCVDDPLGENITILSPYVACLKRINSVCADVFLSSTDEILRALEKRQCSTDIDQWTIEDSFENKWTVGARVMMTKNVHDDGVMNGDEGMIIKINKERTETRGINKEIPETKEIIPASVTVKFNSGVKATFFTSNPDPEESSISSTNKWLITKDLVLSWGVTIHKAQGSEWKTAIFYLPFRDSYGSFFNRNLLYTGISRAKEKLYVVAPAKHLFEQGLTTIYPTRYDNLAKRIKET